MDRKAGIIETYWQRPAAPSGIVASNNLKSSLLYLLKEHASHHNHNSPDHDVDSESASEILASCPSSYEQFTLLNQLLIVREPSPPLPPTIHTNIDNVLAYKLSKVSLTTSSSIPAYPLFPEQQTPGPVVSLWKGDITQLSEVTAIVNTANSALLGCFRPNHPCIDNAIHSAAGPRLREACAALMESQGPTYDEPVGLAKVTRGYNLPAEYILHTVGPQLPRGAEPTESERDELRRCYISCLDAAELLPPLEDGRKVVAFCCISTGMFAFPPQQAVSIAINTVKQWFETNLHTSITRVIFNVFTFHDYALYHTRLSSTIPTFPRMPPPLPRANVSDPATIQKIALAKSFLSTSTHLLITAGAGLSASIGLDYTSPALFSTHFPGFLELGLNRLYDVFGMKSWPSERHKWGYFFTHLNMVRNWPLPNPSAYTDLYNLVDATFKAEPQRYFIRTTNGDSMFSRHHFSESNISTPQGRYTHLQCLRTCRPDAVFPSYPYVDAALPYIDKKSQVLMDESKIPKCEYCGGEAFLCVRGGGWFNEGPWAEGEKKFERFMNRFLGSSAEESLEGEDESRLTILEVGVGMNTPAVLRWPDDEYVRWGDGKVRLVRIGFREAGNVDWEMEERGWAVGIEGEIGHVLRELIGPTRTITEA